jgi:hypothetical protein
MRRSWFGRVGNVAFLCALPLTLALGINAKGCSPQQQCLAAKAAQEVACRGQREASESCKAAIAAAAETCKDAPVVEPPVILPCPDGFPPVDGKCPEKPPVDEPPVKKCPVIDDDPDPDASRGVPSPGGPAYQLALAKVYADHPTWFDGDRVPAVGDGGVYPTKPEIEAARVSFFAALGAGFPGFCTQVIGDELHVFDPLILPRVVSDRFKPFEYGGGRLDQKPYKGVTDGFIVGGPQQPEEPTTELFPKRPVGRIKLARIGTVRNVYDATLQVVGDPAFCKLIGKADENGNGRQACPLGPECCAPGDECAPVLDNCRALRALRTRYEAEAGPLAWYRNGVPEGGPANDSNPNQSQYVFPNARPGDTITVCAKNGVCGSAVQP